MAEPPGEPTAATNAPSALRSTIAGDIEDRGRLPPATAFATGRPAASTAVNEKSVSWLFRKNPPTARPEPNSDSTEVVIEITSPWSSTMTKWLVPGTSSVASNPERVITAPGGVPASGVPATARSPISCARLSR